MSVDSPTLPISPNDQEKSTRFILAYKYILESSHILRKRMMSIGYI